MYRLKEDVGKILNQPADIEEVLVNQTLASKSLSCSAASCNNVSLFRMKIVRAGSYFVYLSFNFTENNLYYLQNMELSGRASSFEFALLQGLVKAILFIASLVNCIWFWLNLKKMPSTSHCFEQVYLKWLTVAMVLFFDPFAILQAFFPSTFG